MTRTCINKRRTKFSPRCLWRRGHWCPLYWRRGTLSISVYMYCLSLYISFRYLSLYRILHHLRLPQDLCLPRHLYILYIFIYLVDRIRCSNENENEMKNVKIVAANLQYFTARNIIMHGAVLSLKKSANRILINPRIVFTFTRQRWSITTFSSYLALLV